MDVSTEAAAAFLAALTRVEGWTAPVLFQTYDDSPQKRRELARVLVGSLREHAGALARLNERGASVAVTVNAVRGRRRLAGDVSAIRAVFIDCDGERRRPLALPTSITVESRHGQHHYWLLRRGATAGQFRYAQRRLASYYGSDGTVTDPSRVMRLPGFFHRKAEPFLVRLVRSDAAVVYGIDDVLDHHPVHLEASPDDGDGALTRTTASETALRAFRAWAARAPRVAGVRNSSAYVMAIEGLRIGLPAALVEADVRAYCAACGILDEAAAVLASARHRLRRERG